jgi:sucrose phosphorylase
MFDAVVNHVSAQSRWFQGFLDGVSPYDEYFTVVQNGTDLTHVFRPRALPLLSEVQTVDGPKSVWTTFSSDQIDLNFANPDVLLAVIDILLYYVEHGAQLIRLDAIAFIWKEIGTPCIHLPETHRIIQLMRSVLNIVAPHVLLITETNVPHEDNISYFGDGNNEAQMVYNFSLPPLTLHAFQKGNAEVLSAWATKLALPSPQTSFFNFLASHDGIGLTPARDLIADEEILEIARRVEALGGFVSYRSNPDGTESPYELNISYIDALAEPGVEEDVGLVAKRFLAAQAIMLSLRGVPGIYFHSLFGSRSWQEGVEQSGQKRRINRQKLDRTALEIDLNDPISLRAQVFNPYMEMLRARASEPAFHPSGGQEIIKVHPALFALWRQSPDGDRRVLCLHNVSGEPVNAAVDLAPDHQPESPFVDLLSGEEFLAADGRLFLNLPPFGVHWLRP